MRQASQAALLPLHSAVMQDTMLQWAAGSNDEDIYNFGNISDGDSVVVVWRRGYTVISTGHILLSRDIRLSVGHSGNLHISAVTHNDTGTQLLLSNKNPDIQFVPNIMRHPNFGQTVTYFLLFVSRWVCVPGDQCEWSCVGAGSPAQCCGATLHSCRAEQADQQARWHSDTQVQCSWCSHAQCPLVQVSGQSDRRCGLWWLMSDNTECDHVCWGWLHLLCQQWSGTSCSC